MNKKNIKDFNLGYSISVEFPNEQTANEMKSFLASEQARLILSEIVPENLLDPSGWMSGDQLVCQCLG